MSIWLSGRFHNNYPDWVEFHTVHGYYKSTKIIFFGEFSSRYIDVRFRYSTTRYCVTRHLRVKARFRMDALEFSALFWCNMFFCDRRILIQKDALEQWGQHRMIQLRERERVSFLPPTQMDGANEESISCLSPNGGSYWREHISCPPGRWREPMKRASLVSHQMEGANEESIYCLSPNRESQWKEHISCLSSRWKEQLKWFWCD